MKYKLVAMDLDNTLLDDNKTLAKSTIDMIEEARKTGTIFTIATGRMYRGAVRYANQLNINVPIITYNGAVIKHPKSNIMSRLYKIPFDAAADAIATAADYSALRYVFIGDKVYTDTPHDWTEQYAQILDVEMTYVSDINAVLTEDPIMVVFMVASDVRGQLTSTLKSNFNSHIRITNSSEWFVDVLHPQASKRHALSQLAQSLDIDPKEIIAIGDNLNDLEMIEYAGLGVAVANSSEELKAAADYITGLPVYSGVEEVVRRFIFEA